MLARLPSVLCHVPCLLGPVALHIFTLHGSTLSQIARMHSRDTHTHNFTYSCSPSSQVHKTLAHIPLDSGGGIPT